MPIFTPRRRATCAQVVDIGDTVEKGQLLAEVYDPERQQEVELTAAEVERAKAAVEQSKAMETAAEAEVKKAEANVDVRKTEISQTAAIRRFREKEYIRYMELARHQAVDQRVADEKQDEYEGAKAAEDKAHASVKAAEAELTRARAQVLTAKANLEHARAEQRVAEARLGQATILAQYTRILSPYTGVVTQAQLSRRRLHPRGHPGRRSADPVGRSNRLDARGDLCSGSRYTVSQPRGRGGHPD